MTARIVPPSLPRAARPQRISPARNAGRDGRPDEPRPLNGHGDAGTRVVFCTYHSLGRVTEAQAHHGAPAFDLAIADKAHRTTGAVLEGRRPSGGRKVDFQEFHDDARLRSRKCLYMTATPRLYTERSKSKLAEQGVAVVDMDDQEIQLMGQ